MLSAIVNGELYGPGRLGPGSVLLVGERIAKVGGPVDPGSLSALGVPHQVLDAGGGLVIPGFVDPHQHLLGAGGEQGFASRMPEVPLEALALAGITTVVGCLGTDGVSRTLPALVAKARQLEAGGVSAYVYTGGFHVPPLTLCGSVVDDLVLIDRVIGVGELAIADPRSAQPDPRELARVVSMTYVGGTLSGKAGVTHFHVGPGRERLALLRRLLSDFELVPSSLYATHVNRTPELLDEGVELALKGAYVDMDTVDPGLGGWLRRYLEKGGPPDRITVSSDSHTKDASPARYLAEIVAAIREEGLPLEQVLPLVTANPAAALKLRRKGRLEVGCDADVVVLERESLRVRHVFARGRLLVRDGSWVGSADLG
ncbi:MAG TPA: amidohydrolase family protein [Longimicrobium sp.]|nr:amidohydrolase family protein [Longimicrobium sp.]